MSKQALPPEVAALWPAPARVGLARKGAPGRLEYFIAPAVSRPRVLVPRAVVGADRMFVRHGDGLRQRMVWGAWSRGHRHDIVGRLPISRLVVDPDPAGIEAYLSAALGQPVGIGVLLGPPRANRKPVIQIFDRAGRTIAFAKLGLSDLTRSLLATEAAALQRLGSVRTTSFRAPRALHHGEWNGVPILVQEALGSAQRGQQPVTPPVAVMAEIAAVEGIQSVEPNTHPYLRSVVPPPGDDWQGIDVSAFHRVYAGVVDDARPLSFGSWHGDFGPWNMGREGDVIEVWDWERYAAGVPVGLDAAHYRTQVCVAAQTDPTAAWPTLVRDIEAALRASAVDPQVAPRVAACYLLTICARYRADAGDLPTPAMRRRMTWLAATAGIAAARVEVATS